MKGDRVKHAITRVLGRGYFPHQFAWVIDNPARRAIISPERLARRVDVAPDGTLLEIGPGSGYFSRALAGRVPRGRLVLLDLQREMLSKARRKFRSVDHRNVLFTAADSGRGLPFRDGSFDFVVMVAVLGELDDGGGALPAIHRVLRPHGLLAVHEHMPDPDRIPMRVLGRMAEAADFRVRRWLGPRWNYTAILEKRGSNDI